MREFHIHTFSPLAGEPAEPTALIMEGECYNERDLDEVMAIFQADAKIIVEALKTLPQGTLDQVLLLLLASRASHYVGQPGT